MSIKKEVNVKKVKTLQKKSFLEIVKLKKVIDIMNEGEVVFSLQELSKPDFNIAYQIFMEHIMGENKDNQEELERKLIPFLMRKMLVSDSLEINGLSDNEIVESVNAVTEIAIQVNSVIEKLVTSKILDQLNRTFKTLKENADKMGELEAIVEPEKSE